MAKHIQPFRLTFGVILPQDGLRANSTRIKIFIEAVAGPQKYPACPPHRKQLAPSFRRRDLIFEPPKAGKVTNLTLQFTPEMRIAGGEVVTVKLTGFVSASNMTVPLSMSSVCVSMGSGRLIHCC